MRNDQQTAFYVANAIPYANAVPHIGHALEAVLGDTVARYQLGQGNDVFFSYGTDEHGGKVAEKAESQGITPQKYVDEIHAYFEALCTDLQVEPTRVVRTTSPNHKKRAAAIWSQLQANGDIYKSSYEGLYDQREEAFVTPDEAEHIKKHDPARYKRLESVKEENYFFKLSKYADRIFKLIEDDDMKIYPISRRNEIAAFIRDQGLEDISISRPKTSLEWGIEVPGDNTQVMYVWLEALMNYITTLGYPEGKDFKKYWPCNVQVLGKDILRFHAAIWPALLMSLELDPPLELYVHGFITIDGQKMSKSVGNVVAPSDIIEKYGSDATRYYLLRHIPSNDDGDFSWQKIDAAYHGELGNDLGNLVQRVASMILRYQDGEIGEIPPSDHDVGPYHAAFADFRFDKALDYTFKLIKSLNQYIDVEQPWKIAKTDDAEHLQEVLAYSVASLLQIADLLAPCLPSTSAAMVKMFASGTIAEAPTPLFPKIEADE